MRLAVGMALVCGMIRADGVFTAKVELDLFQANWGTMYYPRLKWQSPAPGGRLNGFGFIYRDRSPGPYFANHPLTYTPSALAWFSVRTEIGGVRTGYFFQTGPQVNLQTVRFIKRRATYLIASYLPKFGGMRPNNWVVAGATKEFPFGPVRGSVEFYERFFPNRGIGSRYGEAWLWLRPKRQNSWLFAPIIRNNKGAWMFGGGIRYAFSVH